MPNDIYVNMHIKRSEWENLNPAELEVIKKRIFNHYRETGFPYYNQTVEKQMHNMEQMNTYFKTNEIIQGDVIKQTMHCLGTAWTYFPHAWSVKCNGKNTPMEVYESDELFMKAITKRLKRGTYVTDSGIRKELKTTTGSQSVSNFRPSASRAIYDKYGGAGIVYDPSCGFGGRLLGAISSPVIKKYIGCEPSTQTMTGLVNITDTLSNKAVELYSIGSEDFEIKEKVDLIFTSPPYFNTEIYSDEETQSCNKFPEYRAWLDGYLYKTMIKVPDALKKGGYLVINIANTRNAPNLVADFKQIMANRKGMQLIETLKLSLSMINKNGFKYEPVFVYKKL